MPIRERRLDAAAGAVPSAEIPALDDATDVPGLDRGVWFLTALAQLGVSVEGRDVADLGTGYGSIAIAAANGGVRSVVAVDANPRRLEVVKQRAREADAAVRTVNANLLEAPLEPESVDVAFLIGVVEYAGLWDLSRPVDDLQRDVLRFAHRLLRPGGTLVFASKNRLWPLFAVRDLHTGYPLANALPRPLADRLTQRLGGEPYRHHIHSPRRWTRLLREAGFTRTRCFYPYFSYQFPVRVVERPGLRDLAELKLAKETDPRAAPLVRGRLWRAKAAVMALAGTLRIPLTQSVIVRADKR